MDLTEKELLQNMRRQLFSLHKLYIKYPTAFDEFCDLLPGYVHLNKIGTLEMRYLDKASRERLELSLDRIRKDGQKALQDILEPHNLKAIRKRFIYLHFQDPGFVASYFQNISPVRSKEYSWYYSVKKKFTNDLTISISNPLSTLVATQEKIEKLLEEELFVRKKYQYYETLTSREREVLSLIGKGYSSQQISECLFISIHTVNTHRKHLWQKLEVSSLTELISFAEQFELED